MIRILLILLPVLICLSQPTMASAKHFGKSYAVVIGIGKYKHGRLWAGLDYATKDAEGMVDYLEGQGFEVKPFYNQDATKASITSWLEDTLAPILTEHDRVLFFFSGHGETTELGGQDRGYIIPYEGEKRSSTWISMEKLRELASKMAEARHQLFIFDSCFGGQFAMKSRSSAMDPLFPNYVERISENKARQYLTAGGKDEQVRADGPDGYSHFTGYLLKGLQEGKADLHNDGIITMNELAAYLVPAASNSDHTPREGNFAGHESGEFFFTSPFKPDPPDEEEQESPKETVVLKGGSTTDNTAATSQKSGAELSRPRSLKNRPKTGFVEIDNIANPSFEELAAPFDSREEWGSANSNVSGWKFNYQAGTLEPSTPRNPFGWNLFKQPVPDGKNTAFSLGNGRIYQTLNIMLSADTTYILEVDVGDREFMDLPESYFAQLRAGGGVLASGTVTPANGQFSKISIEYNSKPTDPIGTPLEVHLVAEHNSSSPYEVQVNWDNVKVFYRR